MKFSNSFFAIVLSATILSSCSGKLDELKKSSSNKLFDASGFHSNKRRPLYNSKYINKAKENIIHSDYEDEDNEDDEVVSSSEKNLAMYKRMLNSEDEDDGFDLIKSRDDISKKDASKSREELEKEISEIKELLKKTRDDVVKAKCPYDSKLPIIKDNTDKPDITDVEIHKEIDKELQEVSKLPEKKIQNKKNIIKAKPGAMTHVRD
jgi:hypothetical protein